MYNSVAIKDDIFLIGFNDRRTRLFENLWPMPDGVSYNCYVVRDEKCALIDTAHAAMGDILLSSVETILGDRKLDYLVINHMEPDHSGAICEIVSRYPEVKILGNKRTFDILASYFGSVADLQEVADGETLSLGKHTLQFHMTPWVHWPETMMTYETGEKMLFSGDAFGMFGAPDGGVFDDQVDFNARLEGEMRRYYSNIVAKYGTMVQKALTKISPLTVNMICPVHGFVWRENPAKVVGLYDKWSRCEGDPGAVMIVYGTLYGFTAQIADYIARLLAAEGVKDIRVYDSSKTHLSFLLSEAWRCGTLVLGSCAYNTQMFPAMDEFTRKLSFIGLKNRRLAFFGEYSWNGGGVRNLNAWYEAGKECYELVCAPVEIHGRPDDQKLAGCTELAKAVAAGIPKSK